MYDLNPSLVNATLKRIEAMAYSRAVRALQRVQWL